MNRGSILFIFRFVVFILLQVLLFKDLILFDRAFCFVYLGFLLLLPIELGPLLIISIGFFTGLSVDVFYDSLGIHAASSVLIMFLRPYWVSLLTPQGGYEIGARPNIMTLGFMWFLVYSLPLILIHNFALFFSRGFWVHFIFIYSLQGYFISSIYLYYLGLRPISIFKQEIFK